MEEYRNSILEKLIAWNEKMIAQFQSSGAEEKVQEVKLGLEELKKEQLKLQRDYLFETLELETTYVETEDKSLKLFEDKKGIEAAVVFNPYAKDTSEVFQVITSVNKNAVMPITLEEAKEILPVEITVEFFKNIQKYCGAELQATLGLEKSEEKVQERTEVIVTQEEGIYRVNLPEQIDPKLMTGKLENWGFKKDEQGYYTEDVKTQGKAVKWMDKWLSKHGSEIDLNTTAKTTETKAATSKQQEFAQTIAEGLKLQVDPKLNAEGLDHFIQEHVAAFYHLVKQQPFEKIPKRYQAYVANYNPKNYSKFFGMKSTLNIQPNNVRVSKAQQQQEEKVKTGKNLDKSKNKENRER